MSSSPSDELLDVARSHATRPLEGEVRDAIEKARAESGYHEPGDPADIRLKAVEESLIALARNLDKRAP
jgi:hypothetical protein